MSRKQGQRDGGTKGQRDLSPEPSDRHGQLDRHDLYEACVQSPEDLVGMIAGMHGGACRVLGEDFAGTAALSLRWADSDAKRRSIAIDLDAEALRRHGEHPRVLRINRDVLRVRPDERLRCDAIFVGNFSIGYLHDRRELVRYLARSARRLKRRGIFVCDTYGGASTFTTGHVQREHRLPDGRRVIYTWEQREADPISGLVTNAMHFQVDRDGDVEAIFADAFVYHWRVWSIPELADAMEEAGFRSFDVFDKVPSAVDQTGRVYMAPVEHGESLEESFIACVCARV